MIRRPPRSNPPYILFPYPTLFRAGLDWVGVAAQLAPVLGGHHVVAVRGVQVVAVDAVLGLDLPVAPEGVSGRALQDLKALRALVGQQVDTGDRKSTRLNSSHSCAPRMPSSACKKKNKKHEHE